MKQFRFVLPILLVWSTLPAMAEAEGEKHPVDIKVEALVEKAVSTADMIQAYDKGIALWDAELNRVYQALRKALPAPAGEKLKLAQQQWILYRDAQYAMLDEQYNQYDGTMYLPMRVAARMRVTEDRARYLKDLLETQQEHSGQ
jgi:uncharacterized protein YecT (DUF1311 family)